MMRLNQVTASARDLDASIAFYELLGLKLIVKSPHYARFELPRGEATFSLHVADGEIPRANAPQIYFELGDVRLDSEVERLKRAGVAFERDLEQKSWLWREAWLRDPAGNAVCLYHAGDDRRFPPWRIDTQAGAANLHLVIRDGARWAIVRHEGGSEAWRALQDRFADFKTSLGPYTLRDLLAVLEFEWLDVFLAHEEAIRTFAAGQSEALEF
jgi:catechol 2,3-dioxygenase-like lactoylglutathione lyase family enzyme